MPILQIKQLTTHLTTTSSQSTKHNNSMNDFVQKESLDLWPDNFTQSINKLAHSINVLVNPTDVPSFQPMNGTFNQSTRELTHFRFRRMRSYNLQMI